MTRNADPIFRLRLPDDLRGYLTKQAIESRRSLTGEILARLDRTRKEDSLHGRSGGELPAAGDASRA